MTRGGVGVTGREQLPDVRPAYPSRLRLTRRGERVVYATAAAAAFVLGFLSGPYAWVSTR